MLQGVAMTMTERDKWNKLLAYFSWMIAMPIDARFNEIWFNEVSVASSEITGVFRCCFFKKN